MSWWHHLFVALGLVSGRPRRALGATLVAAAVGISGAAIYTSVTGGGGGTFPLHASANGRYLVTNSGDPFLLVGDSPQSGFGQLSATNMANYLADRSAHGFNAVWEWLPCDDYASFCTSDGALSDGTKPFTSGNDPANYDLSTPNSSYFSRVHSDVEQAASEGIVVFLNALETGGCETGSWRDAVVNNGSTKVYNFGAYLGSTFGDLENIVWMIGNDYQCWATAATDDLYLQLAEGIHSTDPNALITLNGPFFIPAYGTVGFTSLDDTTNDWTGLLGINGAYTYTPTYADVRIAYGQSPTLPVIMNEANYENETNPNTDGCDTVRNCRLQEWWTMTSGATGQFYGCYCTTHLTNANYPNNMDTTAVTELGYQTSLLNTIAWWTLEPQDNGTGELISSGGGTYASTCGGIPCISTNTYVSAAKNSAGNLALIYAPGPSSNQTFTVDFSKMSGTTTTARWYDPTNGTYTTVTGSPFTNADGAQSIQAGNGSNNSAGDHDWALLLESGG